MEKPTGQPVETVTAEDANRTASGFRNFDPQLFFEQNRRWVIGVAVGLLAVIVGIVGYRFWLNGQNQIARSEIIKAEIYFGQDSLNLALNGGPDFMGLRDIADEYGATETGNRARLYTGIILVHQGLYDEALDYLKKVRAKSEILGPQTKGLIGDCYSQLGDYEEAAKYYDRAVRQSDNQATTPVYLKKAGLVYEKLGDYDKAVERYRTIRQKFPLSETGQTIDKYIARAEAKGNFEPSIDVN